MKHRGVFILTVCALLTSVQAFGQTTMSGVPNALQGFSQNRGKPVKIDAASLEIRDKDKAATFSGDVRVQQGDTLLRCKSLVVFYDQTGGTAAALKAATPGPGGSQQIRRLEARGGVTVTQKDQTVTGEMGIFDMKANTVTLQGGVVMTQGQNVLRGDRLVVDLGNGAARVESGKSGQGRVQGLFQSSGGSPLDGAVPGAGTPAAAPAPRAAPAAPAAQRPGKPLQIN